MNEVSPVPGRPLCFFDPLHRLPAEGLQGCHTPPARCAQVPGGDAVNGRTCLCGASGGGVGGALCAGNAPTMMSFKDLGVVAPLWVNLSQAIFNDADASREWGWVQVHPPPPPRSARARAALVIFSQPLFLDRHSTL